MPGLGTPRGTLSLAGSLGGGNFCLIPLPKVALKFCPRRWPRSSDEGLVSGQASQLPAQNQDLKNQYPWEGLEMSPETQISYQCPHRCRDNPAMAEIMEGSGPVYITGNVGMGSGGWGHSCLSLLDTPAFSAPPCIWTLPPNAVHLPLDREGEDHFFFTAAALDLALGPIQSGCQS